MSTDNYNWTLVNDRTNAPVSFGQSVKDFRGDYRLLVSGSPPHHSRSTGRVDLRRLDDPDDTEVRSVYPSVVGLRWVLDITRSCR